MPATRLKRRHQLNNAFPLPDELLSLAFSFLHSSADSIWLRPLRYAPVRLTCLAFAHAIAHLEDDSIVVQNDGVIEVAKKLRSDPSRAARVKALFFRYNNPAGDKRYAPSLLKVLDMCRSLQYLAIVLTFQACNILPLSSVQGSAKLLVDLYAAIRQFDSLTALSLEIPGARAASGLPLGSLPDLRHVHSNVDTPYMWEDGALDQHGRTALSQPPRSLKSCSIADTRLQATLYALPSLRRVTIPREDTVGNPAMQAVILPDGLRVLEIEDIEFKTVLQGPAHLDRLIMHPVPIYDFGRTDYQDNWQLRNERTVACMRRFFANNGHLRIGTLVVSAQGWTDHPEGVGGLAMASMTSMFRAWPDPLPFDAIEVRSEPYTTTQRPYGWTELRDAMAIKGVPVTHAIGIDRGWVVL